MKIKSVLIAIAVIVGLLVAYYVGASTVSKLAPKAENSKIPDEAARAFFNAYWSAEPTMNQQKLLAGRKNFSVLVVLGEPLKQIIDESTVQTKFEITLRKCGVPLRPSETNKGDGLICLSINGMKNESGYQYVVSYAIQLKVATRVMTGELFLNAPVTIWESGGYGYAGNAKIKDMILDSIEEQAEKFANDWLAANPKVSP